MKKICIVDYGMGNIRSLENSIKKVGYKVEYFSETEKISSNLLIIPGVGAFNSAMNIFKEKKIDLQIKKFLSEVNNYILGICLGKQILFTNGFENEPTQGLNLIGGDVNLITNNKNYKLPNVGWLKIDVKKNLGRFDFLKKFDQNKFYFVHSYVGKPNLEQNILASSKYKNLEFCSICSNNKNLIGVQFHPEKSGKIGLEFLSSIFKNLK